MHQFNSAPASNAMRHRLVSTLAALGASLAMLGSLSAFFASASSSPWLPNTPAAIAQAAICDQSQSRVARGTCMQQAVARWQAADRREIRLASSR